MYDPRLRYRRRVMNKNISRPVKQTDTIGRHMYASIFLFVSIPRAIMCHTAERVRVPRSTFSITSLDQIATAPARAKPTTWSYRIFSANPINNLFAARVVRILSCIHATFSLFRLNAHSANDLGGTKSRQLYYTV